ncbi:MAG TPA: response regulator [Blattabacteriaceae bacterium]|nr:response regulator [Blattabacteriaceae bacterium]
MCAIAPTAVTKTGPGRPCILCVDDSEEIRLICQTVLEADGYQVITAGSGAAALKLLHTGSIDAVVIDNVMPGMSGIVLAQEIKRISPGLPVILFSSLERPDEIVPFIDSYLSKGQGPLALRKMIRVLLHK